MKFLITKNLFVSILVITIILLIHSMLIFAEIEEEFTADSNTVLLMHFNEGKGKDTKDVSANSNHGEILYEAEWTEKGRVGNALFFDGPQDCIKVIPNVSLDITELLTIEAWIKISGGTRERAIVTKEGAYGLSVWHAPGNMLTGRIDLESGEYHLVHSSMLLREGQWYYVAMTYDGERLKVFIDGKMEGSKQVHGKIKITSNPLYISNPSGWQTFNGIIDEVRISKVVREIKSIKKEITISNEIRTPSDNPFLLVNNQHFFPIGLYCAIWWDDENLKELNKTGFNLIGPRGDFLELKDWKKFLDAASSQNLKVWIPPLYKQKSTDAKLRWATFLCEPEKKEKMETLRSLVLAVKDHPALLIWDIGDEVAIDGIPVEGLSEGYNMVKELDPNHSIWTNHSFMSGFDNILPYNKIADIVSYDVYPMYDRGSKIDMGIIGRYVDLLSKSVENKKPIWMVLQADHGHQEGRFPTERELRFMTYDAIVYGATGIIYFGQDITYGWTPEFQQAIENVVSGLGDLTPILISPAYKGKINIEVNPIKTGIQGICKDFMGEKYLIVINDEPGESIKVKFTFADMKKIHNVGVLSENRTIDSSENSFTDEFKPYDVHIYKIKDS